MKRTVPGETGTCWNQIPFLLVCNEQPLCCIQEMTPQIAGQDVARDLLYEIALWVNVNINHRNNMPRILFKTYGEPDDPIKYLRGYICLGDHSYLRDGTRFLSAECVTFEEAEAQAQLLKGEIDRALASARKRMPRMARSNSDSTNSAAAGREAV